MRRHLVCVTTCLAIASLTGGCLSSPPTHFYTLSVEAPIAREPSGQSMFRVMIDPITIPEVVDRPQLVVRSGPNTVSLIEEHRWAESLKREIPRVLAENVGRCLGTDEVWAYPRHQGPPINYRLSVDLVRLETNNGRDVSLDALWTIRRILPNGDDQKTHGRSNVHLPVEGEGYQAIASAYSRALATVSEEIATAIRSMREQAS